MEKEIVISVKNLKKKYPLYKKPVHRLLESFSFIRHKSYHKDFMALNDISFDVYRGECFGIIGTNGSGKSTLLKIITGVLSQSSGDIKVNGKISALLELGAGFNLDYTGIENIKMNAMIYGYSKQKVDELIPKICEFADIGDFINQPLKSYSSGMFARLAFAVAINVEPDILIVDEALSVGDIFFQAKCYKKFEEFKELGKTILFVTHDMTSVLKYCDRVLLINNGDFIKVGKPSEAVDIYKKILSNSYNKESPIKNNEKVNEVTIQIAANNTWKSKLPLNPSPNIYGTEDAEIIDFGLFNQQGEITNIFEKFSKVKLVVKVKFNKIVDNPIVAFTLKNRKGLEIMGTNTWYENKELDVKKSGTVYIVSFLFDLPLSCDQYLLDLGVTRFEKDNLVVLTREYNITTIDVVSSRKNVGIVDPNCTITVNKEEIYG